MELLWIPVIIAFAWAIDRFGTIPDAPCHTSPLAPGTYCAECGTCNAEEG